MNLLFVLKPYEIEVYTEETKRVSLGKQAISRIEAEPEEEYEKRMTFVVKEVALDVKKHVKGIHAIHLVLCYPWCTYEHVDVVKTFANETQITPKLLDSLKIQKNKEGVTLIESEISHVLLNGYALSELKNHKAREIEMQVLNVYAKTSLYDGLKNTLESIFHTHTVSVTSVYAFALKTKPKNGLAITLEDESVDISYIADNKNLLNVFIPVSYVQLEQSLMTVLDTDAKTVRNILSSRTNEAENVPKTMRHVWPDLHEDVKKQVNDILTEHYAVILKYIHTLLDQVKNERIFNSEEIRVCALNTMLVSVYGLALAKLLKDDEYIKETLRTDESRIFIDYLL